jgi:hypothetical protein
MVHFRTDEPPLYLQVDRVLLNNAHVSDACGE